MPRSCRTLFGLAGATFLWLPILFSSVYAGDGLRTVALTGAPVPGAEPGAVFDSFRNSGGVIIPPALNKHGQAAFQTRILDSGVASWALLTEGGGVGLRIIAREAPPFFHGDTLAGQLASPFVPTVSDGGQTAFLANLNNNTSWRPDIGLFRESGNGDSSLIARTDSASAGPDSDEVFLDFYSTAVPPTGRMLMGGNGQVAFVARSAEPSGAEFTSIWREDAQGELEAVARQGSSAPGTDGVFGCFCLGGGQWTPLMNQEGRIAFSAISIGDNQSTIGVWSEQSDGIKLEFRRGDSAPGLEGVMFAPISLVPVGFNSQGQVSVSVPLNGPGFVNQPSLWKNRGNGLEMIARTGMQAPGTLDGEVFQNFYTQVLNARGEVAFLSVIQGPETDGTNHIGFWSEGGGRGLELVARNGQQAPGTAPGVLFATSIIDHALILNSRGQLAFVSRLQGSGIDESNNLGIWAQDLVGNLTLIARRGDLLNVSDDPLSPDWRTIGTLSMLGLGSSGNDDGRRSWFNDRGQLAFWARFTDGSEGTFVSNMVAVPEPQTAAMLAFGVVGYLVRRYRKSHSI